MKLEDQVTNLEISKKLKSLGVEQESYFYWEGWNESITHEEDGSFDDVYSAFTVAELIELLGNKLGVIDHFKNGEWGAYIPNDIGVSATGKYLPDVLAELLMRVTDMEDYEES